MSKIIEDDIDPKRIKSQKKINFHRKISHGPTDVRGVRVLPDVCKVPQPVQFKEREPDNNIPSKYMTHTLHNRGTDDSEDLNSHIVGDITENILHNDIDKGTDVCRSHNKNKKTDLNYKDHKYVKNHVNSNINTFNNTIKKGLREDDIVKTSTPNDTDSIEHHCINFNDINMGGKLDIRIRTHVNIEEELLKINVIDQESIKNRIPCIQLKRLLMIEHDNGDNDVEEFKEIQNILRESMTYDTIISSQGSMKARPHTCAVCGFDQDTGMELSFEIKNLKTLGKCILIEACDHADVCKMRKGLTCALLGKGSILKKFHVDYTNESKGYYVKIMAMDLPTRDTNLTRLKCHVDIGSMDGVSCPIMTNMVAFLVSRF